MTIQRLIAIIFVLCGAAIAWFILGSAVTKRTHAAAGSTAEAVQGSWGPALSQSHPIASYQSPGTRDGRAWIRPDESTVKVDLAYAPKRKGLVWFRTYDVTLSATYRFSNPTPIPQTILIQFALPSAQASYNKFRLTVNGRPTTAAVTGDKPILEAAVLQPGESATLDVAYETRGLDSWQYGFGSDSRVRNFTLTMRTDFEEIDFPVGTSSPTLRSREGTGWALAWDYPDVIGARPIGMAMPKALNPGPIAARIAFFAPVSLVFFFTALIVLCLMRKVDLHPMNFFFLAAGCFAFQLLFAYLVDLVPLTWSFAISAAVSLVLVSGYLLLVCGTRFARIAATAQFAYMVLFSYSFFFDGLTGLTITIGAIITLAILMVTTAKTSWTAKFQSTPPPLPVKA